MNLKTLKKISAALAAVVLFSAPVHAYAQEMPDKLVPMGSAIGISIKINGIMVAGTGDDGSPAAEAGLKAGDVIVAVDGEKTDTVADLHGAFADGTAKQLHILRGSEELDITVTPRDGTIGVFVRDEINGIGTMTFYDPETGVFGALGHSVTESGSAVEYSGGIIAGAEIGEIVIGKAGAPGQLGGVFDVEQPVGIILANGDCGIYGVLKQSGGNDTVDAAHANEIVTGPAVIRSTVSGDTAEEYDVEIVRIYSGTDDNRCFMLRVTDERLLNATGGIVQGMSGSPVIQNGKLIGAVTHVLISDPTRGYGITLDKMLTAAGYEKKAA